MQMDCQATCQTKVFGREYNLRHDQDQITPLLFYDHSHCDRIVDSLRPRRKITGIECADRIPAWSLGISRRSCLHRRRSRWTFRSASAKGNFPRLVSRARPHWYCILADLFAAFPLRHASQLEWTISCRTSFPSCHHLCGDRCLTPTGFMAFQYPMAYFSWKYCLHNHSARGICNRQEYHASTPIPHL